MPDEISFEHKPDIKVPDKGDVRQERVIESIEKKMNREQTEAELRGEAGEEPKEKKGSLTKDVPQMIFRICGGFIDCKKFELTDDEAQIMATHLNILLPLEGKIVSVVVILMIVLNKVYQCMDAIKNRGKPKMDSDSLVAGVAEQVKVQNE